MPRRRNRENKGLPERWAYMHGAYYYRVPPGLEEQWDGKTKFRLGKILPDAYKEWSRRLATVDKANTVSQLLDRYTLQVIPTKSPATREGQLRALTKIREVFGHMALPSVKPQDIYRYADRRGARACMRQEIAVLSHAYTKAVEWGYAESHPFKGEVRLPGGKARTRYVEDGEIAAALALKAPDEKGGAAMIQGYIRLKLLTGMRQGDMLRLREADLKEDGIYVMPHKTRNSSGKAVIYQWTPELEAAVAQVRAARPLDISKWLFCNRYGDPYIDEGDGRAYGFASIWQRFMDRLISEAKIERFAERDIRAKTASDADSDERARELLSHTSVGITRRVYRRKPATIKPLR